MTNEGIKEIRVKFTLNMEWGVAEQGKTIYAKVKRRDKELLQTKGKRKRPELKNT